MKKLILLMLVASAAAACSSARAQTKVEDVPSLAVPPPPPRVIEPLPSTETAALEPVPDLPPPPAPTTLRAKSPTNRDRTPPEPKPEVKTEPPAEPAPAPPAAPVPPLRTAATVDGPAVAQQVRDTLSRASKILTGVDYSQLGKDSQENYNAVKNFIRQAEEQLKANNTVAAKSLAERAEDTAKLLGGR